MMRALRLWKTVEKAQDFMTGKERLAKSDRGSLRFIPGWLQVVKIFLFRKSLRNFPLGSYFLASSMKSGIFV